MGTPYCSTLAAETGLLLAHPDIDVNVKDIFGRTPFFIACLDAQTSCVWEMLKDSRVKVNEPNSLGFTPLWAAAAYGHLDIIRWWIASGREVDLGKSVEWESDVIGLAKVYDRTELVVLLERFKKDAAKTRHAVRVELGLVDELAAEMFAIVVFVSDGLLQLLNLVDTPTPVARFLKIITQLPLELQMVLCYRLRKGDGPHDSVG